jgi:uncharacterized protein
LIENSVPVTILRFGIVLSAQEGTLPVLTKPIKMGLNVLFNKGKHHISWIHIADLKEIVDSIVAGKLETGVYNIVSPGPISQKRMNDSICHALGKPTLKICLPAWILRILIGERISLLTDDQYIEPLHLLNQGYKFKYAEIDDAAKNLLRKH